MAPLRAFRFLQVGTGPVLDRVGTLLTLLGAEAVVLGDEAALAPLLARPGAPGRAGRHVLLGDGATAAGIPHHGLVGGAGSVERGPGVVAVAAAGEGAVADGLCAAAAVVELLSDLGGRRIAVDGPGLATERARLLGLPAAGAITAGGAGRLVQAADGWVAVNLPRPSDLELLGAWLGRMPGDDHWSAVTSALATLPAETAVRTAQELGLAVARVVAPREAAEDEQARARHQPAPMQPFLLDGRPTATAPTRLVEDPADLAPLSPARFRPIAGARVVDLSSLWAGPLATSLLSDAGAEVIKVESTGRTDGARAGDPAFFDLLHAGKRSVALDLPDPVAVAHLQALVDDADLVVEASRPRALDQLGIVRHRRWLTLTAYGATGPWRQWSGFGDDAAVAGGLVSGTADAPAFYGDAVADPLAGLYAAAAALAVLVGEPASVDLALREVANHVVGDAPPGPPLRVGARRHRPGAAPALGEGNHDLLRPADAPAARAR